MFTLQDVEKVFEKVELLSFNEHRKIRGGGNRVESSGDVNMKEVGGGVVEEETELVISAHPSGSAIGGTCWKIEYNKQLIVYAIDLNDVPLTISVPMMRFSDFKNANLFITNGYTKPKSLSQQGLIQTKKKAYKFLSEEKLRGKLERVLVDSNGQIMIPISDKNMVM